MRETLDLTNPAVTLTLRHESGHTVVGLHLGFQWRHTSIGWSGDEPFGGAAVIERDKVEGKHSRASALVAAAGFKAEENMEGAGDVNQPELEDDRAKVKAYVSDENGGESFEEGVWAEAAALVGQHAQEIDALAAELGRRNGRVEVMTTADVWASINSACDRCNRNAALR